MVIANAIELNFETMQVSPRKARLVKARLRFPNSTDFASELENAVRSMWPKVSERTIDAGRTIEAAADVAATEMTCKDFYGMLSWLNPLNSYSYSPVRLVYENGTGTLELEPSRFPTTSFSQKKLYFLLEYLALIAPIGLESMPFYKQLLELREKFHVLKDNQYRTIKSGINARIMKEGENEDRGIYSRTYDGFFTSLFMTAKERDQTGKERDCSMPVPVLKKMVERAMAYANSKQDRLRFEKLEGFMEILNSTK